MREKITEVLCVIAGGVIATAITVGLWAAFNPAPEHDTPAMVCQAERSDTAEGVEIIAYPIGAVRLPGVEVPCP